MDLFHDISLLQKEQIGGLLGLEEKEWKKTKKEMLIDALYEKSQNNEVLTKKIYRNYTTEIAMAPSEVEEVLEITKGERQKWTKNGLLSVVEYKTFQKWGKSNEYPVYDRLSIRKIDHLTVNKWRESDKKNSELKRANGSKKAQETQKANKDIRNHFYNNQWKSLLVKWFSIDYKLGATIQLCFWTLWINRWAKENQKKLFSAKTKAEAYKRKSDELYSMKNVALKELSRVPFVEVQFYEPDFPDKIQSLHFCEQHYYNWVELRNGIGYVSKWEFFHLHQHDITTCSACNVEIEEDYYSLYLLNMKDSRLDNYQFSFHIPYQIGKQFLPPKESLTQVKHDEQEGLFRFGRELHEGEKIIFRESDVVSYFKEALQKFRLYF